MTPFRWLSQTGQALLHSILFASYTQALTALHNVTVDDAVTTGAVVPQYLPQGSWNIGNTCTRCFAKPNPTLAYDGTWHDITFSPGNGFTPTIEFSYTGSSVYIFFILANTVPYATTNTNVDFILDGARVGTYNHAPSNSSGYQYNVPVYVNNSVTQGEHSLVIQPVTSLGNDVDVLILFDYLIYTTDADTSSSILSSVTSTSVLPSVISTSAVLPSSTSSTQWIGPNIGAIAGVTVGGVVAVTLVAAFLLCYSRRNRRKGIRPAAEEGDVGEPFATTREVASTPFAATIPSIYPAVSSPMPSSERNVSALTPQALNLPTTTAPSSSSGATSSNNHDVMLVSR